MTVEIGELRARLTAESQQMRQQVAAVKKDFADLGEQGKKTSNDFKTLDSALAKIGNNKAQIASLTPVLENVNARIEIQRKKLTDLKASYDSTFNEDKKLKLQDQMLKTEATLLRLTQTSDSTAKKIWDLEDSINATAQSIQQANPQIDKMSDELRETETEAGRAKQGISALASGIAALGAGATLSKLVGVIKTLSSEAHDLSNSYQGLAVVSKSFNIDSEKSIDLADKLADRWGLNKGVISDTVKTYLSLGMSLEETERLITATADAAVYNREAHLSWEEAIKNVSQGIKAGNSNLTDSAGITTNLSVMQDRYAKSIGTTAAKLTEAQKIQAAYNGMLEEGAIFAGNADDAMSGYTGTQATFNSTLQEARVELGEAYLPVIEEILENLTPMIKEFSLFVAANKDVAAGATAATAAVLAMAAAVATLTVALRAFNVAMGPVGWGIAIISTVVAGVTAYSLAADAATESVLKFAGSQDELNEKLTESPLKRSIDDIKAMQSDIDTLNGILDKRNKLMVEYNQRMKDAEDGRGSIENTHALFDLADGVKALDKELKVMGYTADEAEKAVKSMNSAIEASTPALREMRMEELRGIAAKQDAIKESETLSERYRTLRDNTKRTADDNEELTSVIRQLTARYPELHTEMDAQGQLLITNEGLIRDLIAAEEESVNKMLTAEAAKRASLIRTTEASIKSAEAQIAALKAVAEAEPKTAEWAEGMPGLDMTSKMLRGRMDGAIAEREADFRNLNGLLNEYKTELAAIENGTWTGLIEDKKAKVVTSEDEKKKKTKEPKVKTKEELEREQYQAALKLMEYKKNLDRMNEKQELAALEKLQKQYAHNADIRMELEVKVHQLKKQMAADEDKLREEEVKKTEQAARERFEHSSEWITQEERRMVLAGESEEAITQMKLEAWTRVRSRYEKDSAYYKQADTQLYNLRVGIMKQQARDEHEAAKEREKLTKDNTKKVIDAIDKAKKAELDALSDRRKAIQKFYDDQGEIIDEGERLKERNELVAEMDKYRFATSEKGQKHFLELQEKLRKMDIEDQKRNLEAERDQKLEELDKQKNDIESWFNELREATSDLTGDLSALYKLADDERLKSFVETNALIKAEMESLQRDLASYTANVAVKPNQSIIAQMQANSAAWHTADAAARKKLDAENKALGASIGASYNSGSGTWTAADGMPLYHTGGIAGEMNFRSGEDLMPDEIQAILKRGEPVLTPQQANILASTQSGSSVHIEKVVGVEMHEVVMEDDVDLMAYERNGGNEAAEILRKQLTGGG